LEATLELLKSAGYNIGDERQCERYMVLHKLFVEAYQRRGPSYRKQAYAASRAHLEAATQSKLPSEEYRALVSMARVLQEMDRHPQAVSRLLEAIEVSDKLSSVEEKEEARHAATCLAGNKTPPPTHDAACHS